MSEQRWLGNRTWRMKNKKRLQCERTHIFWGYRPKRKVVRFFEHTHDGESSKPTIRHVTFWSTDKRKPRVQNVTNLDVYNFFFPQCQGDRNRRWGIMSNFEVQTSAKSEGCAHPRRICARINYFQALVCWVWWCWICFASSPCLQVCVCVCVCVRVFVCVRESVY
jgi:hypothetical protein